MIIDGKVIAREVRNEVKEEVERLNKASGVVPGLGVVLVGSDPSSHIYVRNKEKPAKKWASVRKNIYCLRLFQSESCYRLFTI